jgi:hypothetical protein
MSSTYLMFIPRRRTRRQDIILDTTRRKMIQHRMIRHNQHARVVLMRRLPVQNAFAQKARQRGRRRQIIRHCVCARALGAIFMRVEVAQEPRDELVVPLVWLRGGGLREVGFRGLHLGGARHDLGRVYAGRLLAVLDGRCIRVGFLLAFVGGGCLGGTGRRLEDVVGRDFDVVDEDVCVVDCGGHVLGCAHFILDEEGEVVGAWCDVDVGGEDIFLFAGATIVENMLAVSVGVRCNGREQQEAGIRFQGARLVWGGRDD